ncbi:MAG: alpha/beta hydrolase [Oscillospiraceae bacterium]
MKKHSSNMQLNKIEADKSIHGSAQKTKVGKVVRTVLTSVAITVVIYFGIAFTLIFTDAPAEQPTVSGGIAMAEAMEADYSTLPDTIAYTARDGSSLPYRLYEGGTERLIVLVHGSGWHGMQFHPMASKLAASGLGTVVVPDLRGHGANPERRGDIDYIVTCPRFLYQSQC